MFVNKDFELFLKKIHKLSSILPHTAEIILEKCAKIQKNAQKHNNTDPFLSYYSS